MKVPHIDDFERSVLHVDFGVLDDGSGVLRETEVGVPLVAHDALEESAAHFVAAKIKMR